MKTKKRRVAVIGGGLGGLTAAIAIASSEFDVQVFEQARDLREVGAGISITPNGVKVLRALGLEDALRARGFKSEALIGRDWTTARPVFCVPLKDVAAARYGAPNIDFHRADLLDILATSAHRRCRIHLDSRCVAVSSSDRGAIVTLSDGRREEFDLVVGCDGIHSVVREALHGRDAPRFTGNTCWRALVPVEKLPPNHVSPDVTIWTGSGGHIVTGYVRGGTLVAVAAIRETADRAEESWSMQANTSELVAAFPQVHWTLRLLLERADHRFKGGLFDRDPLPTWGRNFITLLGDAAHPMLPFLGQGASMAFEDAYVLSRELCRSPEDVARALRAYEAQRIPRTAKVQLAARKQGEVFHLTSPLSRIKRWFQNRVVDKGRLAELRTEWLYSYDPTCCVGAVEPNSPQWIEL
jgi:salicylate hydroxylase